MHRAFTLMELMVSSCISAIILTSLCMALTGVWREVAKTNAEMQVMLKASSLRDRLLVGTADAWERGFHGLLNITNEVSEVREAEETNLAVGDRAKGTDEPDESLPGATSFVFRRLDGEQGIRVESLGKTNVYGYSSQLYRVRASLWVESQDVVCQMPVAVTVVRDVGETEGEEEE